MRTFLIISLSLLIGARLQAQVNAYAKVTSVSGTTINISNVNESYDSFEAGDKVIIMQMQDNVLGANTGNNSSFGNIESIESAGVFEVLNIISVTESGGTPTSITVESPTAHTYNFNTNSSVQLISYPRFGGGGDYTTTSSITCMDWNGNIGGVIAFYVEGKLTVAHNIIADGAGFKGGTANTDGSSGGCNSYTYRIGSNNHYAAKGEGIYKNVTTSYELGRGKIANGAGGGNSHNGGGGGGGNYTAGGEGGAGWQCSQSAGGIGGLSLDAYISSSRVFLGGGGGSGEGNNFCATAGGNGGGIILIDADSVLTTGSCSGVRISADGDDASNTPSPGNDAAGGGGAGGSIVMVSEGFRTSGSCALTIAASGGAGGTVSHSHEHGAGGGGGMGTIIYSIPEPTNVTTDNTSGSGGANGTGSGATTTDGGGGSPDDGVIDEGDGGSLPVELMLFDAQPSSNGVHLNWQTASELNNDYFEVLRSDDMNNWWVVARQPGNGTSDQVNSYEAMDVFAPKKTLYYRLKQVDFDGTETLSKVVVVDVQMNIQKFEVFPNPASHKVSLSFSDDVVQVRIYDLNNRLVNDFEVNASTEKLDVDVSSYEKGMYMVSVIHLDGKREQVKLVVM